MAKISVCIPCVTKHVPLLRRCIISISKQTILPDEVIISISGIEEDKLYGIIRQIEDLYVEFKKLNIRVLYEKELRFSGENRNRAISIANGDLITFIDADDLMMINRIAFLKWIFDITPSCIGILHFFTENNESDVNINQSFDKYLLKKYQYSDKLHYGHITLRKEMFDEFSYTSIPRGQDFELVEKIISKYLENLYMYEAPLSCYISNNSTFYNNNC
jgi:glycosyltransferase involved in cell wall biosynthesis